MHLRNAESWEGDISRWSVHDRSIELHQPEIGYRVTLSDGVAYFRSESSEAYQVALRHAGQLVDILASERKEKATATVEAQHLLAVEEPFEALVSRLAERLLKDSPLKALNARLFDFNYMVDTRIEGRYHQFNIGAVRADEISMRVAASRLKELPLKDLPPVALFCSIVTRKAYEYQLDDLSDYVVKTMNIGNTLLAELDP